MAGYEQQEILQNLLSAECVLVHHPVAPNFGQRFTREHIIRTSNQGSKKPVELFEVHSALGAKPRKDASQLVNFLV
jgi:hypothetical protein